MNGNFTMIDNDVFRSGILSVYEIAVYGYLLSRQGGNVHTWPSHARIAKDLNIGEKTVRLTIAKLIEKKLVCKTHRTGADGRRTSNSYVVAKSLPQSLRPTPSVPRTNKEKPLQEDSEIKSPSEMGERSWKHMDRDAPITDAQLDYIADLVEQLGDHVDDTHLEDAESARTQGDAHQLISALYGEVERLELKGAL